MSIVNGELQFAANHNVKVGNTDTFEYTIKDADGSTSTNTLTVTIGAGPAPAAGGVSSVLSANESQLPGGSGVIVTAAHTTVTASFTAGVMMPINTSIDFAAGRSRV